jgi:hypothetical protein
MENTAGGRAKRWWVGCPRRWGSGGGVNACFAAAESGGRTIVVEREILFDRILGLERWSHGDDR